MSEIESGPTTRLPWEYQPYWAKEQLTLYRPLFHAGVGGLKIPLDPKYTRPDRVRKNQEELEYQANLTQRAQNALRYWSDLKSLIHPNNFIKTLTDIYKDQSHVIGNPPNTPSHAITDSMQESTQMNKLYKSLFNKYLTEQTNQKNPTPIELMKLGVGENNHRVKTTYHPETGGESIFSKAGIPLVPEGAAYQDVLGTLAPMAVAEIASYFLTRGRIGRAIDARTKLMTRKVQKLKDKEIEGMQKAAEQLKNDRKQIKDDHATLGELSTKEDMARDYLDAQNRYKGKLAELGKTRRSGEIKAANRISGLSDDRLLKNSTHSLDKLDRIPVLGRLAKHPTGALAAAAAGHSLYNQIGLNQELTQLGLRDDDASWNDYFPGMLGVLQSYALARGIRKSLPLADRHIQRSLIGNQAKSIPAKLSDDPSQRAKYLLYKEPVSVSDLKFTKNDPRLRTRAYVNNPDHGIQAWEKIGSSADEVKALGKHAGDMAGSAIQSAYGWGMNTGWLRPVQALGSKIKDAFTTKGPGRASLRKNLEYLGIGYLASDLLKSAFGGQFTNTINPARGSGASLELGTTASKIDPRAAYEFKKFGEVEGVEPSDVIYSQRRAGGILDKFGRQWQLPPYSDNRMLYLMKGSRTGRKNPRDARDAYESEIARIKADIKRLSSI